MQNTSGSTQADSSQITRVLQYFVPPMPWLIYSTATRRVTSELGHKYGEIHTALCSCDPRSILSVVMTEKQAVQVWRTHCRKAHKFLWRNGRIG